MEKFVMRQCRARRYELERRQQRLPDTHLAVQRLRMLRAAVAKLTAVAVAAHEQNDRALYAALQALDGTSDPSGPSSIAVTQHNNAAGETRAAGAAALWSERPMQSRDPTYRFCPTHGQWVVPIREHVTTWCARSFTQWLCPLHDARNRTLDNPHFDSAWPQVHFEYHRAAGDANTP